MKNYELLARIGKVFSVDTRVQIVDLLKKQSLCVNALAEKLNISPAAVSQHLRILRDVELVTACKHGYFIHYQLNSKTLNNWKQLTQDFLKPN
jgi:DNA-binding transcriptional ArsR family regulator